MPTKDTRGRRFILLDGASAVGAGPTLVLSSPTMLAQSRMDGTNVLPSASIVIEGSTDSAVMGWVALATVSLSANGETKLTQLVDWAVLEIRARVVSISADTTVKVVLAV